MSTNLAADLTVTGSDQLIVIGVAVIAVVALVIAFVLRASVLAAGQGTPKMQEISEAVQEGAGRLPRPAVPDAGDLRGHRVRAALRTARNDH